MNMRTSLSILGLLGVLSLLAGCSEQSYLGSVDPTEFHQTYEILGGQEVVPQDPVALSAVMLLNVESNEICSGTLVSRKVVLTAAHCIPKDLQNLQLYFALNPLEGDEESEGFEASDVKIHPEYDVTSPMSSVDLALVQLKSAAPFFYVPAKIVETEGSLVGQEAILVGFGVNTEQSSSGFGRLRQVKGNIVEVAGDFFEMDQSQGSGICDGDSGGPVLWKDGSNVKILGVSKLVYDKKGTGAANCLNVGQFTSVQSQKIRSWIQDFIQKTLADAAK